MRPTPTSPYLLLGTGFYLVPNGGFATAAHVALEAQQLMSGHPNSVGIIQILPDGRSVFRPVWKFFIHTTADVAFGIPHHEIINNRTGKAYRAKVLSLDTGPPPNIGASISTWAYPFTVFLAMTKWGEPYNCNQISTTGFCKNFLLDTALPLNCTHHTILPAFIYMVDRVGGLSSMLMGTFLVSLLAAMTVQRVSHTSRQLALSWTLNCTT